MRTKLFVVVLMLGTVSLVISTMRPESPQTEILSEADAIELLRVANTAQLDLKMTNYPYAPLDQLVQHRFFSGKGLGRKLNVTIDSKTGAVRNYEVFVFVAAEGKRYNVSLVPMERGCQEAFFTDDSGIIYKAQALGCQGPTR